MCGYDISKCQIYGSLDVDQKERHPDKTFDTCKDYAPIRVRHLGTKNKGERMTTKKYFVELRAKESNYKGREWLESREEAIEFAELFKKRGWDVAVFEANLIDD